MRDSILTDKLKTLTKKFKNIKISETSKKPGVDISLRNWFGYEKYNFSMNEAVSFFSKPAVIHTDYLCFDFEDAQIKTESLTFSVYGKPETAFTSPLYRGHFSLIDSDMFVHHAIIEMKTDNDDTYLLWQNPNKKNYEQQKLGTTFIFNRKPKFSRIEDDDELWQVTGPHNSESIKDILLKNTILPDSFLKACEYAFSYYNFCVGDSYRDRQYQFEFDDNFFKQIVAEATITTFPDLPGAVYYNIYSSLEEKIKYAFGNATGLQFSYHGIGMRYPYYNFQATEKLDRHANRNKYHPVFNTDNKNIIESVKNKYHEELKFFRKNGFLHIDPSEREEIQYFFKLIKDHESPLQRQVLHSYHKDLKNPVKVDRNNPCGDVRQKNITGWHLSNKKLSIGDILDSANHTSYLTEESENMDFRDVLEFFPALKEREDKKPDYIHSTLNGLYSFLTLEKAKNVLREGRFLRGAIWIYEIQYEGDVAVVDESLFDTYENPPETAESRYKDVFRFERRTPEKFQPDIDKYWAGEGSDNPVWSIIGNKGQVVGVADSN